MTRIFLSLAMIGSLVSGNAWAAGHCVRPQDEMAMRTAALQQQLMVAALSCGEIARYNQFVVTHRSELQQSDKALMAFFKRENGARGTASYHAFKTKAANISALESAKNRDAYCENARQAFDVAFDGKTMVLASFVRSQSNATAELTCTGNSRHRRMARGAN